MTPLRIYEPRIDSWFDAQPPSSTTWVTNSVLVSNQPEGMLLSIGGFSGTSTLDADAYRVGTMSDRIAMLDINSGKWTKNPSGCKWPGASHTGPRMNNPSLSATAYDEYSVMVVAGARESQARVDVLDLRTWRWREGIKQLQRPQIDSKGVSVVAYEGKVLALGGGELPTPEPQAGGDGQDEQQQQQQDDDLGGQAVYSYDPAANTWSSDTIARLPFNISMASPVVARVSA